jgi:4-hydroxy-tetrahydrodipicolinate reductase
MLKASEQWGSLVRMVEHSQGWLAERPDAEAHMGGHAFHTYRLTSPDGLVSFEFMVRVTHRSAESCISHHSPQHNVCGRSIYAEGTIDAAIYIAARAQEQASQTVYTMVEVAERPRDR